MTAFFLGLAIGIAATTYAYPSISRWIDRHF